MRTLVTFAVGHQIGRHVLDQAVGIDRAGWDILPITTRREIITAMCDVTIMPAGRGHRAFDPTLIKVRPRAQ